MIKEKSYLPVSGNIRLTIPNDLNFRYGDFIRFHSTLKKIQNFKNPGGFNYERLMNMQGIYVSGFINNNSEIILLRKNTAGGIKLKLEKFRCYLKEIIYKNSPSPQKEVIEAMTIGNQNKIPADIRDNFSKTGTSHILSISGLHVGMVGAVAFFFVFLILKSSEYLMLRYNIVKLAAISAFLMILVYALIAGMGVTVMRATLMAFVFLLALLLGKQNDLYNTLAFAALIILAFSPEALFDISFQFSFGAVLAIIYIVPRFSHFTINKNTLIPGLIQSAMRYVYLMIVVCMAATIGTLPLMMYYFNRVSCLTIVANLIAVPLLGTLSLAFSMFAILFSLFSVTIAGFFVQLASWPAQISISAINKLANLSWSSIPVIKPNLPEIVLFYFLIFLIIQFVDERKKKTNNNKYSSFRFPVIKYSLLVTLLLFTADITYLTFKDQLSSDLKITVIDVGQGNSMLVEFPCGQNMIIDGGGFPESSFDTGRSIVAPFLYYKRIWRIDTAVLSHPHPDHLRGLIYILDNFSVRQIWKSKLPIDPEEYPEWEKAIQLNKPDVYLLSDKSPEKIFNGVAVKVLWPSGDSSEKSYNLSPDEINDTSLVLKITFGKTSFLVPGDISKDVENQLIKSGADLKSDVLVVPHHGSNHSSSAEFIKAVACRYAIISAGKSNVFKHPHPSVLRRYQEAGVKIIRTDQNGAITLKSDGKNLYMDTFITNR
jgi:competence protein ComEC